MTSRPTNSGPAPHLAAATTAFLETLAGKSPHTLHTYTTGLGRFSEFVMSIISTPSGPETTTLPPDILESFYTWLVRQYGRDSRATHNTYVAAARALMRFLERRGWGPAGVTVEQMRAGLREVMGKGSYKTPRIDPALPLIVTYVESLPLPITDSASPGKLLSFLRDRALVRTLFCTGMRREEIASLNREDVAEGRQDQAVITGKGAKERVVFFDEPAMAALRDYLAARDDRYVPLFIRHDRGRGRPRYGGANYRITPQTIFDTVKRYAAAVGVDVSPHDFRHTKASVMLNAGASLSEVQDILGHASPETTKRIYAHYETTRLREAFDRYSVPAEELSQRLAQRNAPPGD